MTDRYRQVAIFLIAGCAHLAGAAAQNASETWRCGNSYSDQPCPGGKAVDASDPRSGGDRRAADAATRQDRATAEALERERLKREALARREGRPVVIGKEAAEPVPARHAAKHGKKKKGGKEPEFFTAHDPAAALQNHKKKKSN